MSNLRKEFASSIKSMKQSGADIQQFLQSLFKTAVEGNAEMAAMHEQALSLSTSNTQARIEGLNEVVANSEAFVMRMASSMVGNLAPLDLSVFDLE